MKKDKFLFLSLFGKIDDVYIEQSFLPWDKNRNRSRFGSRYCIKIACAVLAVLLAGACIFHTEVEAAFRKITTMIGEMLGIVEDLSPYTEIINMPVTENGLTLTLDEAILDRNELLLLVSQRFEEGVDEIDTELLGDVRINGEKADILKSYITDSVEDDSVQKYVLDYYLRGDIADDDFVEIEAVFRVNRTDDGSEIGKYHFGFHTSWAELEKNTARVQIGQSISISENAELKLLTFTLNSVESNIVANCDNLPMGAEYYLKGKDDRGNYVVYRLISYENPQAIFVDEEGSISPDASWIELQLYRHSLNGLFLSSEEGGFIEEELADEDVSQMEKIGDSIRIGI